MPLHGKIVVIKRSGGDGTEFPLTATCLFGRKPDCDIRIQLPQVSKEHCRIDLNENKEIILTNLSSVNPTRVNGEALQQSERLKHGDVITIIDRSFRFEYPPAPTPKKKRSSVGGKTETLKVLQDQQVGDTVTADSGDKRISEVSTDPHLKDGTNHDNIQRSLDKTMEVESKEETGSPFSDLYQMIKKSLDVKTPRKSSASVLQTPTSRFCTPKPASVRKNDEKPVISTEDKSTPKKDEAQVSSVADVTKEEVENAGVRTPKSVKKQRRSSLVLSAETAKPEAENAEAASPQKRIRTPPQRFTPEIKSPVRRRSKEATPTVKEMSKKRKSGELAADLPTQQTKKKRVSFGGYLCPELFDKRLPPDSPLRKGASPRRSLCVSKPKQSLLRRASVIGLLQEFDHEHPDSPAKRRTPSPKKCSSAKKSSPKTPTPGKKSPKSRSPSPKAASPAKKSPKSSSPSPKAVSSAKKSPSPARGRSPTVRGTSGVQTPKVQGRFSVSLVSTPSPVSAVADQAPLVTATPKRKSISRETPSRAKSAAKVMRRSSGISRASLKVKSSWADRVRFGQPKPQVVAPVKQTVIQKPKKKAVPKPQTPVRNIKGHFSTGHADSPVTIVVGRAHRQKVVHPTGAAPRLVTNTAVLKKDMKMDEDLTGISDIFKTPANARKRRSVIDESEASKTPVGALGTSVVEPSVLNTPEEPGEMMVSPLSVASTVKDRKYNSEAVQRLLNNDQESSFISDTPALEIDSEDSSEQQGTDLKTPSVTTPKQKPELPECLTGVKRIMKTPRQKAEPVEDLRGKILKTPKQKPEPQECLTGVKRIMKTPRQKAEPVEDLRGKILKTPKQKSEQQECLTGVKRIMKTPRQKAEPIEDLRGKILKTPKQKPAQQECLTGVKRMMATPRQEAEPVEDIKVELLATPKQKLEQQEAEPVEKLQEKLPETPKAPEAGDAGSAHVEEPVEDPVQTQESEITAVDAPNTESSACLTGMTKIMKTPRERSAPVEDMVGVKRLMKTPRVKGEAVEENFGIKRLMKTPKPSSNAPVEDFEGLQELTEEPLTVPTGQMETNEVEDQTPLDCDEVPAKELDFSHEEPQDDVPSDVMDVLEINEEKEADANEVVVVDHPEEVPSSSDNTESSDAMETVSQAAGEENVSLEQPEVATADEKLSVEQPEVDTVVDEKPSEEQPEVDTADETVSEEQPAVDAADEKLSKDQPEVVAAEENIPEEQPKVGTVEEILTVEQTEVEPAAAKVTEMDTKKSVRGRRAKTVESKPAEDKQEAADHSEDAAVSAPVRGRRGKKTEATAPPAVRQTRGRNAKPQESGVDEPAVEKSEPLPSKVALKPKRGRNAKKASEDQAEVVQEVATETEMVPEPETEPSPPVDDEADDSAAPLEKAVIKTRRGRKTKEPEESVPEQQDVPSTPSDEVPQADVEKDDVCSDQLEAVPSESHENKPSEAMETVAQVPVTESLPEVETCKVTEVEEAVVQKKMVRSRRAKLVESKPAEEPEAAEEPVVSLPVRGRRGKKTEAAAPAAVRQTTRGRNAKPQENPGDDPEMEQEKAVETPVPEISTEAVSDQTSSVKENDSAPPAEEAVVKPVRGRKTKQTPVEPPQPEPEKTEAVIDEPETDTQPQKSVSTLAKPRRGRKTKADAAEQNEVEEDAVVAVETKEQTLPPVRGKRGRNAKQEEEKLEATSAETTKPQEPAKKTRRTRKAEQDHVEPSEEEVQAVETVAEEAEAPLVAEPVKIDEPAAVAAKPRRGGRKAKQGTESETPVESTEVQEVPAATSDKLKRGRRGKQVAEEVVVPAAVPEEKLDHEVEAEEKDAEPETPVVKPSRARGTKTSAKNEVSQAAVPAKRARRGAAPPPEENDAESTVVVSEPVEPVKRGRRAAAAAAKPTADKATVASVQANPSEDASDAVVEEAKTSKRSVKWKTDLEVLEIPKATPVKAVRGRKTKLQADTESKSVSKDADKSEEKDLSDEVVEEAQPVKRARRGAKVADVTADEVESTSEGKSVEAETQPKTRRGRSAKK